MKPANKKLIPVMLLILMQCVFGLYSYATDDPVNTNPLLGSAGKVKKDSVSMVVDYGYFTHGASAIEHTWSIKNLVSVGIEEESKFYIQSSFTATVTLHISKYNSGGSVFEEFDSAFTVSYDTARGSKYNAAQYLSFENAYKVQVKIVSIDSGAVTWPISNVLRIDNSISVTRDYVFDCSANITGLNLAYDDTNDELHASWGNPNSGQTEYDLEWAWIDESAILDYQDGSSHFLVDKIFDNNATRISTTGIGYNIPLLYDGEGRLFVRVRPVQLKNTGQRIEGNWTPAGNTTTSVFYIFTGHQNALNWQATTSFAEEGKRKSVIQYFDGTLRNRQTVTKDNTTNTTVVAESFYDYQGRPVIQVLPSPTISNIIQYSENFNKGIDNNFDGYPKWAYDKLAVDGNVCTDRAQQLDPAKGTARYYSPNNDLINTPSTGYNINRYIPDAAGYPFTETRFAPDGRVAAQGGVGVTHQLGSTHETRYFYEPPAPEELDALFGTDAGVASHYTKNIVKDANGQYSISYVDMNGKTVATALAGKNPDQLDALPSKNVRSFTKQLLDEETNHIVGRSIVSSKPLVVLKDATYHFDYTLLPDQLNLLSCSGQHICYDCLYRLKFSIISECSGVIYQDSSANFTIGQYLNQCNSNGKVGAAQGFSKIFDVTLPEGEYTINKVLTLSGEAQDYYRDNIFVPADTGATCKNFMDYYNAEYNLQVTESNCNLTCEACNANVGATFEIFEQKFLDQSHFNSVPPEMVPQLQASYNEAKANCARICNANSDDGFDEIRSKREVMLLDMMPPYGQYARLEDIGRQFNIFTYYQTFYETFPWAGPAFRTPIKYVQNTAPQYGMYYDELGQPDQSINPHSITPENFSANFKDSWAEQLLPHHPEYGKLKVAEEQLKPTYQFEANVQKVNIWNEAVNDNYITNLIDYDPFFTGAAAPGHLLKSAMIAKMNYYLPFSGCFQNRQVSMWQVVLSSVFCVSKPIGDCSNFSSPLTATGCMLAYTNPTNSFNQGCVSDRNIIWQHFRILYFAERKKLISQYIDQHAGYNTYHDIVNSNYFQPRFVDLNANPNTYLTDAGDLTHFFNQLGSGDQGATTTGHDLEQAQYDTTCRGYAATWIMQLSACELLQTRWANPLVKTQDSAWLVPRLREICKSGSDPDHYLGSSSLKSTDPSTIEGFREFPDVIKRFMETFISNPFNITATCHPYLITVPPPYDMQTALVDQPILTKPSDCECTQITSLEFQYEHAAYPGNFSSWLQYQHGTYISQADLDVLLQMCRNQYSCAFLPAPIVLPSLLQCHGEGQTQVKTCINCQDLGAIIDSFHHIFNLNAPIKDPANQAEVNINIAFEHFANHLTGFHKTWSEYLEFEILCKAQPGIPCHSLDSVLALYTSQHNTYNDIQACRAAFALFFNNAFNQIHTFDQWMALFQACGETPNVCNNNISCSILKDLISQFYDYYGTDIYLNGNVKLLFTTFVNSNLQSNFSYNEIDSSYQYLCQSSCPLEIDLQFNSFLLTSAYNGFMATNNGHPWDLADCSAAFVQFFNDYFNITGWDYDAINNIYTPYAQNNCAPDIKTRLCVPPYSCSVLDDIISGYISDHAYDTANVTMLTCQQLFAAYFNIHMGTNYTYQDIADIYSSICDKELNVCTKKFDCKEFSDIIKFFMDSIPHTDSTCVQLFTEYFNLQEGPGYAYQDIVALYRKLCDNDLNLCNTEIVPTDCEAIMKIKEDFKIRYPDPATSLHGECESMFTTYFNTQLGSDYSYAQIKAYYLSLCNRELDVCSGGCSQYQLFYNDFNAHYSNFSLPLLAKENLLVFLYNKKFPPAPGDDPAFYDQVKGALQDCISNFQLSAPDSLSAYDQQALLAMKQVYYLMHSSLPGDCENDFSSWFNLCMHTSYTYSELFDIYNNVCGVNAGYICAPPIDETIMSISRKMAIAAQPPLLCGLNQSIFNGTTAEPDPCSGLDSLAFTAAEEKWQLFIDSIKNVFDTAYYNKCMGARYLESFKVTYEVSEYHYTLYYYDQAGNLVKTVPPAGVDDKHGDATFLANVAAKRLAVKNGQLESLNKLVPDHTLVTEYRYNTLNQVIAQKTPDAGKSYFYYDRLGRLVVSQNAKQHTTNKYSYTLYDELGRITQVGQKPQTTVMTQAKSIDPAQLDTWLNNIQDKEQITRTVYDITYYAGEQPAALEPTLFQRNLRNRVSYTQVIDAEPAGTDPGKWAGKHTAATYYSYDIHGNVNELLQDFGSSTEHPNPMNTTGNRYKKINYDYDLISGKVNEVSYQAGYTDQFYHKYLYDAENRITDVLTSHDNILWEKDARYSYYKHGPLARTIIGQQQVQGLDYAYTLQGWLKGINSTSVNDGSIDIGGDGIVSGTALNQVARDAYGFSLNYFNGDYNPISSAVHPFAAITAPTTITTAGQDLFNGNIGSMAVNIPKLGTNAYLYRYRYDQLNRIKGMDAFTGLNNTTNTWTPVSTTDYNEAVTYDPNGNILTYHRNGAAATSNTSMDDLTYGYNMVGGKLVNNRLRHVKDAVTGTTGDDIKNQNDDNYGYDEIGNLIRDDKEGLTNITWNVYGKIESITKSTGTINYTYDASGNRISKTANGKTTFYVRDASGNTMSVYGIDAAINSGNLTQNEVHLYGSSRLGIFEINRDVHNISTAGLNDIYTFTRGNKFFELSNHLGNVLVTVSDRKLQHTTNNSTIDYYNAEVVTANDYYPFGMSMPGRKFNYSKYRYGFNGKQNDNEVKGEGNQQDYGARIYDPRIGKFLSVDPIAKSYPQLTPYQFASNKPINGVDLDGLEWVLKIYDPQAISDFVKASKANDIYKQRGVAYQAIHSKFSEEDFWNRSSKNPGIVAETNYDSKTKTYAGGELIYDKKAPSGVTYKYQTESKGSVTETSLHWNKGNGSLYDDNYPVDVRTVNSPEQKDFYGTYDFVGKFSSVFGSAGAGAGAGTISGYMKGYGRVNYTTQFFGAGTPSAGVESGMLTGNFNIKNYSPATIAGYGGSQGWGVGFAATAQWYSFKNYADMKSFNTSNATISGEQNALSLSIVPKVLKGFSASRMYSITTLIQPLKK